MRGVLKCLIAGVIAASVGVAQSQFQGSVPSGTPSATPLALTLHGAIDRGLRTNPGLLMSDSVSEAARGQRLQTLSALLPQLDSRVSETIQQINGSPNEDCSGPWPTLESGSPALQTDEGAWIRIAFDGGAFESSTAGLNLKSI